MEILFSAQFQTNLVDFLPCCKINYVVKSILTQNIAANTNQQQRQLGRVSLEVDIQTKNFGCKLERAHYYELRQGLLSLGEKGYMYGRVQKEGNYQWESRKFIGEGSFGKVYKGMNVKTKEDIAVKVLDIRHFSQKDLQSLKNEIEVMKLLTSPNVVRLLDCINNAKETYLFMEFCEGGDLRSYIDSKGGKLQEKQAIMILNQVLLGLHEVYEKGYMHRDIKPENILLSKGTFKIADFGFATKIHQHGRQLLKEFVGTPLYMAPQLLENSPYTPKSDVWSIGMTFFEMIFGKTPWPARDINSFLKNIKTVPLRFPYDKPIGKLTKDFIMHCLTINEDLRMNWEELFNHELMKQGAGELLKPQVTIDDKTKKILRSMQEMVQAHNLNIHTIFDKFDKDKGGDLDEREFWTFLQCFNPRINLEESKEIFKVVDSSNDKKISLGEFAAIFCHYDFADIDDPAQSIITDLKEIIKANDMNLEQIFSNFDKEQRGTLGRTEFEQLLRIVAPAIKGHEVQKCFEKFDNDHDAQISFDEFKHALGGSMDTTNNKQENKQQDALKIKAKRVIGDLRKIIKENNIDIKVLFKNFDKTKDSFLDQNEFKKLILILDKGIFEEELNYIFKIFDTNNDDKISFSEFATVFS